MKKLAILISILLIAGLSVEAQKRPVKTTAAKTYKKTESKEEKSSNKSTAVRQVKSQRTPNARAINTNTSQKSNSSARAVVPRPEPQREARTRSNGNSGVANVKNRVVIDRRNIRPERRPVSIARRPIINNIGIRHGYIDRSNYSYGYSMHRIMTFPMRVRYPFYQNYNLLLMHSYRPQIEYPWAIYESENNDNTASIEGQVIDVDYNRRTNQYVLHFGRRSPYQSATVIIPDYLSQYIDIRDMRKLKRDYVSVYGVFTQYGNVPTIMINSLDEFYVNEMPLKDYLYYH